MKIKTIQIYDDNKNLSYEGQIIISDDNSFEGIVSNPFHGLVNAYIAGKYKKQTDKLTFNIICPEAYPDDVLGYTLTKSIRKGEYIGEYKDYESDTRLCYVKVNKIIASKDIKEAQAREVKALLDNYIATYDERVRIANKRYNGASKKQKRKEQKLKQEQGIVF